MNTAVVERQKSLLGLTPGYWVLLMVALVSLFLIGLDQGQALSAIMGEAAYQQNLLHELFHDVRHAAGFMCH